MTFPQPLTSSQKAPLFVFCGLAPALFGCPAPKEDPPPPPASQQCAVDQNFTIATAATLRLGAETTSILCPARDQEYYRFEVEDAGSVVVVKLKMSTNLTRVNPSYRIIRDDGSVEGTPTGGRGVDSQKSAGEATDFIGAHRLEEAGTYVLIVEDSSALDDAFDIDNAFTLTVELVADPDQNEPNNTAAQPTAAPVGTIGGQIATTGDEDWYAIAVPAGAQIVDAILTAPAQGGVAYVVSFYAPDAQAVVASVPAAVDPDDDTRLMAQVRTGIPGGQTYFLVVKDAAGTGSQLDPALGAYSISFTITDNPDLHEAPLGNDETATATHATSGQTVSATLATLADRDMYEVVAPAGTTANQPRVLRIDLQWEGLIDPVDFQPQITIFSADPEGDVRACDVAACGLCDDGGAGCMDARLQRYINTAAFSTAFPLRDTRPVFVVINEFGDDAYQEGVGYTIRTEVVVDPDAGEHGDDYLVPNLESAGYENQDDLRRQLAESRARARPLQTGLLPSCDERGQPAGDCLPRTAVPNPVEGIDPRFTTTVNCSEVGSVNLSASGRLSYEGDRDLYVINDLPEASYWALNFNYGVTGGGSTPLELTLFVYSGDSAAPIANALDLLPQGGCLSSLDCADGSICVDGRCWQDGQNNTGTVVYPQADQCAFVSVVDDRPIYIQVVDNGINDFDLDRDYQINLTVSCGCPTACNPGVPADNRCQGVAPPP